MNKRLLAEFATSVRAMCNEDLYPIAADDNFETYSQEYVTAAIAELSHRGVVLPEASLAAGTQDDGMLSYRSARDRQRVSQPYHWLALALLVLTILMVLVVIWHASYVRKKGGRIDVAHSTRLRAAHRV